VATANELEVVLKAAEPLIDQHPSGVLQPLVDLDVQLAVDTAFARQTVASENLRKRTSMKTVNVQRLARAAVAIVTAALALSSSAHAEGEATTNVPRYAGALTFAPDGTLFVGDNISSAVFAYKTDQAQPEHLMDQLQVEEEDGRLVLAAVRVIGGGCGVRLKPSRLLKSGKYRITGGPLLEDVAGNRINEALDHSVNEKPVNRQDG
jgi:hypothetical protein